MQSSLRHRGNLRSVPDLKFDVGYVVVRLELRHGSHFTRKRLIPHTQSVVRSFVRYTSPRRENKMNPFNIKQIKDYANPCGVIDAEVLTQTDCKLITYNKTPIPLPSF